MADVDRVERVTSWWDSGPFGGWISADANAEPKEVHEASGAALDRLAVAQAAVAAAEQALEDDIAVRILLRHHLESGHPAPKLDRSNRWTRERWYCPARGCDEAEFLGRYRGG